MKPSTVLKVAFALVLVAAIVLGIVFADSIRGNDDFVITNDSNPNADYDYEASTVVPVEIVVYVSGHVHNPGVFTLYEGARIWQAIESAGGMTEYADENAINLAAVLTDGQHIRVLAVGEADTATGGIAGSGGLVNINTASATQLTTLSGIGPARAEAIIRHRDARGGFRNIEEIMNVSGIGEAIFDNLRDRIYVE